MVENCLLSGLGVSSHTKSNIYNIIMLHIAADKQTLLDKNGQLFNKCSLVNLIIVDFGQIKKNR